MTSAAGNVAGSSPLARGTRPVFVYIGSEIGLIPARAGNTQEALLCEASFGAHPRSRGEHPSWKTTRG